MVFCSLIASSAIRAFISALKLRRCLDFISAPFPRQRFYTLLTGPNFGEHFKLLSKSPRPQRLCVIFALSFVLLSLSLPRRRGFPRVLALAFRHPLIIRRRLFQQFLPCFHLRARRIPCRGLPDARLVRRTFSRRRDSFIAPQRLSCQRLEFLQARQLLQIAQPKSHQKLFRRLVQNRPPHHFLPPRRGNQVLVQQRADHPRSVHSANLRNLRRSHRLLVGNHRQRLQRRHGQPQRRPQALDKPPHHVMLLRLGIQLVPARHRTNLDPALFRRTARHQFIQRRLHRQLFLPQRARQLMDRRRLVRRVNNRFQRRFSLFVSHALFSSLRILCVLCVSALSFSFLLSYFLSFFLSTFNFRLSSLLTDIPHQSA